MPDLPVIIDPVTDAYARSRGWISGMQWDSPSPDTIGQEHPVWIDPNDSGGLFGLLVDAGSAAMAAFAGMDIVGYLGPGGGAAATTGADVGANAGVMSSTAASGGGAAGAAADYAAGTAALGDVAGAGTITGGSGLTAGLGTGSSPLLTSPTLNSLAAGGTTAASSGAGGTLGSLIQTPGVLSTVGTLGSALIGAGAAQSAADTQAAAARDAANIVAAQKQPWVDAGKIGLAQLQTGIQPGGQFNKPFTSADAQNSDAMKFTLGQGLQAMNSSAAAKGGLLSTNAIQDQTKYAEGVASTYQNQAFNQWLAQTQMALGATESLAQTGQTASTQVADTAANAALASGGAQAGATAAMGNLFGNALTSTINNQNTMDALAKLFGSSSAGTVSPGIVSGGSGLSSGGYTLGGGLYNLATTPGG